MPTSRNSNKMAYATTYSKFCIIPNIPIDDTFGNKLDIVF